MNVGALKDVLLAFYETSIELSEEQIGYILEKALYGIHYLHSHGILHRDIKASLYIVIVSLFLLDQSSIC